MVTLGKLKDKIFIIHPITSYYCPCKILWFITHTQTLLLTSNTLRFIPHFPVAGSCISWPWVSGHDLARISNRCIPEFFIYHKYHPMQIYSFFSGICNRELQMEEKDKQICFGVERSGANMYLHKTDNRYLHSSIIKMKVITMNI